MENQQGRSPVPAHMAPILEVRDLHVGYRSPPQALTPALSGVNLTVERGEVLGILGESGSGKSTLAAALLRLLPATGQIVRGEILFEGKNLLGANSEDLRRLRGARISLVFQEPSLALHPTMRIGRQVEEVLRAHGLPAKGRRGEKMASVLAELFGADAGRISSSYPHQLSGGQRQRVAMAQAIACGPSLLIADEPTAALDSVTQAEILGVLARLRRELHLTIILITHNPALLAGVADRVLVLYAGEVAEVGPARTVLTAPKHPYTQALLRCLPPIRASREAPRSQLPVIPGDPPQMAALPSGCRFEPRCHERMAACAARAPASTALGESHSVSCFKYGG
jgi:oligopeptide/dipeptide ABC transporter ATP-binding protein